MTCVSKRAEIDPLLIHQAAVTEQHRLALSPDLYAAAYVPMGTANSFSVSRTRADFSRGSSSPSISLVRLAARPSLADPLSAPRVPQTAHSGPAWETSHLRNRKLCFQRAGLLSRCWFSFSLHVSLIVPDARQ